MVANGKPSYQTFLLSCDFQIKIEDAALQFQLSDHEAELIERIWQEEVRLKGDKLFNGQMLSYLRHNSHELHGCFVDYKYYLAVLRQPSLRDKIPIETLGVSGLTISDGWLLWGKRASFVTEYAGYYECAPSGGINPEMAIGGMVPTHIPYEVELLEETGISKEQVTGISPVCLVYDVNVHLYECVARIEVDPCLRRMKMSASEEYDELVWVEISKLAHFLDNDEVNILPMSRFLAGSRLSQSQKSKF